MDLKFKLSPGAKPPVRAGHDEDAGYTAGINLFANIGGKIRINSQGQERIPTGVAFEIPKGKYGQLQARSGFAARTGSIINAGVIDANYRGEIQVLIINTTNFPLDIKRGDGIAQMVILPVPNMELVQVDELSETKRAEQGFSSTEE